MRKLLALLLAAGLLTAVAGCPKKDTKSTAPKPTLPKAEPDKPKTEPDKPKTEPDKPKAEPDKPKAEPDKPKTEPDKDKKKDNGKPPSN